MYLQKKNYGFYDFCEYSRSINQCQIYSQRCLTKMKYKITDGNEIELGNLSIDGNEKLKNF